MAAFRRQSFSTVLLRLAPGTDPGTLLAAFDAELRLKQLDAKPEDVFYAEQSKALASFIRVLGLSLATIFSIGAIVGAMITMFGSVASRTAEIGTLRALGFRRRAILAAFLGEALALALVGGVLGLAAATFMQAVDVSTTNFATFAELAFTFTLTPAIAAQSLVFALAMGVLGGFVPALRAARTRIVDSLRAA
jgi:ABC-type antimicrobial peptide transport system permease subunit